jgi:nitronate monooxygenase
MPQHPALARAAAFCEQFNLRVPILMAPMASACPASLAIAVANAGGLGGCGALPLAPEAIRKWAADVRAGTNGGFQFNLWIPDPPPKRDAAAEAAVRDFLANWGPPVPPEAGNVVLPDFQAQCDALLEASPAIVSSIMGLYSDRFVAGEDQRHQMVRNGDDCARGKRGRTCRCRRRHRARHGSRRPSQRV